jgi:HD-GYP domain-containing protein (c-di-GMP phosphodiesterase class II)
MSAPDGAGYPDGLAGDRSYRNARSSEQALAELRRCAGSQFDPVVAAAFCALAEELAAPAPQAA